MFVWIIPILYVGILIPVVCIDAIDRKDIHPTMQALAMLILAPFVWFLVNVLRLHL